MKEKVKDKNTFLTDFFYCFLIVIKDRNFICYKWNKYTLTRQSDVLHVFIVENGTKHFTSFLKQNLTFLQNRQRGLPSFGSH